jgi:tape measure domain-containing protein
MTEKILKIRVDLDTQGMAKMTAVTDTIKKGLDSVGTATERITALEVHRRAIVLEMAAAQQRLLDIVNRANAAIESGARGHNLAVGNTTRAVEAHNAKLRDQLALLGAIDNRMAALNRQPVKPIDSTTLSRAALPVGVNLGTGRTDAGVAAAGSNAARQREEAYTTMLRNMSIKQAIHTEGVLSNINKETNAAKAAYARRQADLEAAFAGAKIPKETKAINDNSAALDRNINNIKKAAQEKKGLIERVISATTVYHLFTSGVNRLYRALADIPKAGLDQQSVQFSLLGIFGSDQTAKNLDFLADIADKAGQSITVLEQAYARYAPSARLAGAQQEVINKSFRDFAEVGTILHLPADKINSLFLALDQMFAKGVTQSEEIKKQLGNVLPGAVEIGARAWGKTPAAFMEAMRKNEVIAKEFVPKFAAMYRQIFGGVDDSVFESVRTKLQSNLFRMSTAYTNLDRAIFAATQSTMNEVVKLITAGVDKIRTNLVGLGQIVEGLSVLIATRLTVALTAAVVTMGGFTAVTTRLAVAMAALTGLSNPVTAAIGATVLLYGAVNNLSIAYNEATGFVVRYKDEQVGLTNYIKSFTVFYLDKVYDGIRRLTTINMPTLTNNPVYRYLTDILNPLELVKNKIYTVISGFKALAAVKDSTSIFSLASPTTMATTASDAFSKSMKELQGGDRADQAKIMQEAMRRDNADFINRFTGTQTELAKAIVEGKLKADQETVALFWNANKETLPKLIQSVVEGKTAVDEEIRKAFAKTSNIAPMGGLGGEDFADPIYKPDKAALAAEKAALAAAKKERRDYYQDIQRDSARTSQIIAGQLKEEEARYSSNTISIYTYYKRKEELLNADVQQQLEAARQSQAIAERGNDKAKVEEYSDKVKSLLVEQGLIQHQVDTEKYDALRDYNDLLAESLAKYKELQGDLVGAAQIRFDIKRTPAIEKFQAVVDDPGSDEVARKRAQNAINMEKYNRLNAGLQETINALSTERNEVDTLHSQKLQEINVLTQTGAISQLDSLSRIKQLNLERIEVYEKIVAGEEAAVAAALKAPDGVEVAAKIRREVEVAKGQLRTLKAEADVLMQYFETALGSAFESSFANLIQGSISAREAFTQFSVSIQNEIAKIVASEMRSKLLKPLFGLALDGLGALAGGLFGGSGGQTAGFTETFNSSNFWSRAANGHATSGLGSASGTVLTSPTLFPGAKVIPFASGGIMAGEAGAEAVLPLKRNSKGKLGVSMEGSGGGSAVIIQNMSITLESKDDATSAEQADMIGKAIRSNLKVMMQQELASSTRSGGQLNPTQMAANF